jgi:hypothetical protein
VTGIAFVPAGPHNGYADGAWLTPAGYDRIFAGAHYSFKFHAAAVALRPPVTGDDVEPHTLPAGVPCAHARRSSLAAHENFRRPWYVLRDSVAGSVHEICRWAGAVTGAPGLRGAGGNA